MPADMPAKIPMTIVMTSEFDFLQRDALVFIERLRSVGRLLDFFSMPGVMHGYECFHGSPEAKIAIVEANKAWKAYIDTDKVYMAAGPSTH